MGLRLPLSVRKAQLTYVAKRTLPVVAVVALGASAHAEVATYTITEPLAEISAGKAPVGAAASGTMALLAVRRVWKIIRSSI